MSDICSFSRRNITSPEFFGAGLAHGEHAARSVGAALGLPAFDLDQVIAERAGLPGLAIAGDFGRRALAMKGLAVNMIVIESEKMRTARGAGVAVGS